MSSTPRPTLLLHAGTLQGRVHLRERETEGRRLRAFLGLCEETGTPAWVDACPAAPPAPPAVLVVPTLLEAPTAGEIDDAAAFVEAGGGLWLLSNHDPFHEHDDALARRFGLRFEKTFFHTPGAPTRLEGARLSSHPLLDDPAGGPPVRTIVTNTTCSLPAGTRRPVASLRASMRDRTADLPAAGRLFAAAIDPGPGAGGRVLATADSGFLGDPDSVVPGPGLIGEGDNRLFVSRALRWLARLF